MKKEAQIESIRQRLLNMSRASGETFDYLLTRYGIERVLYRLGKSEAADQFILKGATLFYVWNKELHRPTRDLDLLGYGPDDVESLRARVLLLMQVSCPEDGLTFDEGSLIVSEIREASSYGGARVKFRAMLGNIRIPIQMDVGYGDAITPAPETHDYPILLPDMPGMQLKTYPTSTVIAEKFEALVRLDAQNTRMKDFFDLDYLLAQGESKRDTIDAAIKATFKRRGSVLPTEIPTGLTEEFAADQSSMWMAFLGKNGLKADAFEKVVARIRDRLKWVWEI
jgi:predicted nucleotidyltransferase component of viral defense system